MSRSDYEIQPEELKRKIAAGDDFVLLDVRRPDEVGICALPNAVNIPIDDLQDRLEELDPAAPIVVFCHHGVRSLSATAFLRNLGFTDVHSLAGGIDLWSRAIDPSVPRY
jgi:rhodanese-related sulfurtransferase